MSIVRQIKKTIKRKKIQSDAWSRLRTIRSGVVFDNILTFLYELVQNSQRVKATEVDISVEGSTFILEDNGKGCEDSDDLFKMDFSGFGVGYGIGFTSVYPIADKVRVETRDWATTIDVVKVVKEGDLSYELEDITYLHGFKVILEGEKIREYEQQIIREVKEIVSIIPKMNVRVNGELVHKRDLFEAPYDTRFHKIFKNEIYKGRLAIAEMSESGGVEVYYDYRHVCKFYLDGITGVIHIDDELITEKVYKRDDPKADKDGYIKVKEKRINLKSPDRKSIIWDEKRTRLRELLEEDLRELCKMVIKEGTDEEVEMYADTIDKYISVEEYIRYLTIDDSEILSRNEMKKKNASDENTYKDGEIEFEENEGELVNEEEPHVVQSEFKNQKLRHLVREKDTVRQEDDRHFNSYVSGSSHHQMISKSNLGQVSIKNIKKKKNVVWVEKKEQDRFQDLINKYEKYRIFTFVSPHVLYDRALEHLGITHIRDVEDRAIEKQYTVTNTGAKTKKEQRAMELLGFIERELGLNQTFYISDIDCKMIVSLQDSKLYQEKLSIEGYVQEERIHLNRKCLQFGKLSSSDLDKERIGINDVKFIFANADLIFKELSCRIYGMDVDSKEQYKNQMYLQNKISEMLLVRDALL